MTDEERIEARAAKLKRIHDAAVAAASIAPPTTDEVEPSAETLEKLRAEGRALVIPAVAGFLRAFAEVQGTIPLDSHHTLTPDRFLRLVATQAKSVEDAQSGGALAAGATSVAGKLVLAAVKLADRAEEYGLTWHDVGLARSREAAIELVSDRFNAGFARAEKDFPGQNLDPVGELKSHAETPGAYFVQTAPAPEKSRRGHVTAMLIASVCDEHTLTWDDLTLVIPAPGKPAEEGEP